MENRIHMNELVKASAVYDTANNTIKFERVLVLPMLSLVHYTFDGEDFVDIWWEATNGWVHVDECMEPSQRYTQDDAEFHTMLALASSIPQ